MHQENLLADRTAFDSIRSPYDNAVVGKMPVSEEQDVERAIERATKAFDVMRKLPRFVRGDILLKASQILVERKEEVAKLIALMIKDASRLSESSSQPTRLASSVWTSS